VDDAPNPIAIAPAVAALRLLPDRRPSTTADEAADAFARLADYRDGGIFVGHWAGTSEWERHPAGDELVLLLDGETEIFFLIDGRERSGRLVAGDVVVVPQGTWHRFETSGAVKVLSVTPQPSEYRTDTPT
jgi:uncharacterized cupin superfamily protein